LLAVGATVAILIVVVAAVTLGNESEEDLATKRCQDKVLTQLASPATTKFVGDVTIRPEELNNLQVLDFVISDDAIDEDRITRLIRVNGSFDTQNRFGATVRGNYTCKAAFADDEFLGAVAFPEVR